MSTETLVECPYIVGQTIPVNVNEVKFKFNTRHGWDGDDILPAYLPVIDELKQSILNWGYQKNRPIVVYPVQDDSGNWALELEDGHNRLYAAKSIVGEDPETLLSDELQPSEVWAYVTKPPASLLRKLASQRDANKSLGNTSLDVAKAINTLMSQKEVEGQTTKTGKEKVIGEVYGLTRQQVGIYNKVYSLPSEVLDWIQEGELTPNGESITLSFTFASRIITEYGADAPKLLLETKRLVDTTPEKVDTHGRSIKESFLHSLAEKMGFGSKKTEKNSKKSVKKLEPVIEKTSELTEPQTPESTPTNNGLPPWVGIVPTDTITPSEKQPLVAEKKQQPQPKSPIEEKIKSLIIKSIEKLAPYFVDGRSDATQGLFIVSLPIDLGEDFAELVASIADPNSNPVQTTTAPIESEIIHNQGLEALQNIAF